MLIPNLNSGRGFNPVTTGNETGYLISAINWNDKRKWVGGLSLFYDYFDIEKDNYCLGRTGSRITYKRFENERKYEMKVKTKVIINFENFKIQTCLV